VLRPQFYNPSASNWSVCRSKRVFDVAIAIMVLAFFAMPMLLIAMCVRLSSKGPAIFAQNRMGRRGRLFAIYKFRSMEENFGSNPGPGLTKNGDCRITSLGRWLRKLKLDELPQFYNVLRGDMSLVGPRPKLPQFVEIINMPYRPGITGAATILFRNEEDILSRVHPSQLEDFYHQRIKPVKARVDVRYMRRATLWTDIRIFASTLLSCLSSARTPATLRKMSGGEVSFVPLSAMDDAMSDPLS
jgi:lipopolysaccharide/colanic/teichoic acid biosynthesis glycosyltransferase